MGSRRVVTRLSTAFCICTTGRDTYIWETETRRNFFITEIPDIPDDGMPS